MSLPTGFFVEPHIFFFFGLLAGLLSLGAWTSLEAQVIPHRQEKPPNDPRDATTAAKLMTVPEGFTVEVVASEPEIVNPVAMAIDEKGRYWITESLEYPRRSAGPGRDRVKILEDTDGDGRADKFTVFLDGLNIPSAVQVGHGGVWIANAPDLLFVPDANRDGVPDGPAQVVVTGFGRDDTHELPNSLTWGPDGWLYGLNGVFNPSHVKYGKDNPNLAAAEREKHPGWKFTVAMFRIHPQTREFQVFCEGTSNPWGIAFNDEGEAFISACVIDHLWHLVETGYYHRQGGPYPPHTWKIESIVKHKHQKAAYCGITWFDSDAYPEQYRKKLYMGNIHGGCINVDRIERSGSTYAGFGEDDFLTANDAWFMPVVQKTGPDGSLYILDWYDRYHCYQDANRDPEGIDRLKGRLYRVRYKETPRKANFDLVTSSDDQLVELLANPNVWTRGTAQRILEERLWRKDAKGDSLHKKLLALALNESTPAHLQRAAFQIATFAPGFNKEQTKQATVNRDPLIRAWALRTAMGSLMMGTDGKRAAPSSDKPAAALVIEQIGSALSDADARVRLQALIAMTRAAEYGLTDETLHRAFKKGAPELGDDAHAHRLAWQTVKAFYGLRPELLGDLLASSEYRSSALAKSLDGRLMDWVLSQPQPDAVVLQTILATDPANEAARQVLNVLATQIQTRQLAGDRLAAVRRSVGPIIRKIVADPTSRNFVPAALLATTWGDSEGYAAARKVLETPTFKEEERLAAAGALVAAGQDEVLRSVAAIFDGQPPAASDFKGKLLATLSRLDDPEVSAFALAYYPKLAADLQPKAIELLTQRPSWAAALLAAMEKKQIPASALSSLQARRIADLGDEQLSKRLGEVWGQVRSGRDPQRERVVAEMRHLVRTTPGDAVKGQLIFSKVCGQCHKMYGEGAEVGPEITLNGRNDYTQLLSNIFDPNLVIGAGYRSCTVITDDGRALSGLLAEDSPERVVLKVQGGKVEIIPRNTIEEYKLSELSLMPEGIEKQLSRQEIADLMAYVILDKPPGDPSARQLPGTFEVAPRESNNPAEFGAIFQTVAPGFAEVSSGLNGVGLLKEYGGQKVVVRTHPVDQKRPMVAKGVFDLPADKPSRLLVHVANDSRGDFRLVVKVNGKVIYEEIIGKSTTESGWARREIDLAPFAGTQPVIEVLNEANNWAYEFAYWGELRVTSEAK
ncbi:Cytochrome c [Planctopirus ephydatiae]|uniref:Cytochrome c n=1 Tax=Planctopirus ephydatiae TaxID=2528019 RepID=A0A518GP86_9PLAN|nr:Cytochrome c [Planctopirus ephydatiae]